MDENGEFNEREYDLKATLTTYSGNKITVEGKIACGLSYGHLPCRCTRGDQIDVEYGIVDISVEGCSD
jgi:hypothetical protein